MCLEIVLKPVECKLCSTIVCSDCLEILKIAGKRCLYSKCQGNYKKANKFLRETLNRLTINCGYCTTEVSGHDKYLKHLSQDCESYFSLKNRSDALIKTIKNKNLQIEKLQEQVEKVKTSITQNPNQTLKVKFITKDQLRNNLITFDLEEKKKMEIYNAVVKGDVENFKFMVLNLKYPYLEEISTHKEYWTSLHYAMHYGQLPVITFILEIANEQNKLEQVMRLESKDGRCPLLCMLKSNFLSDKLKEKIVDNIFTKFSFSVSTVVKKELHLRDMNNILSRHKR